MADGKELTGISHGGKSAEERFLALTGATKPAKAGDGDAVLGGAFIEVKAASKQTLNQVRAVKYIPLVVYTSSNEWYVVPAHAVVQLVSAKSRGQHTENQFESATLSLSALTKYKVKESQLRKATLAAIAEAAKYPELKAAMDRVLQDSRDYARRARADVTKQIAKLELEL